MSGQSESMTDLMQVSNVALSASAALVKQGRRCESSVCARTEVCNDGKASAIVVLSSHRSCQNEVCLPYVPNPDSSEVPEALQLGQLDDVCNIRVRLAIAKGARIDVGH